MKLKTIAAALTLLMATSSAASANCMLGAFFSSDDDVNLQLFRSDDGVHMTHIFNSSEIAGRDPSLRYYNGAFYLCLVEPAESGKTFKILRSTDLMQWTTTGFDVIKREKKTPAVWAPDLFIDDDGSAYVYFAKQTGKKSGVKTFDIYVSKADSIENPEFRAAEKLNLGDYDNVIDAHVCKLGGQYYLIAKNEAWLTNNDNKSPILFRSNNPSGGFVEVKKFPLRAVRGYEGFSIASEGGKVYVFGDNYSGKYDAAPTSHHTVWIADAKDIETGPYRAEYVESARPMRHGSLIALDAPTADKVISQLQEGDAEKPNSAIETRLIDFTAEDFGGKKNEIEIENFAPAPNVTYRARYKTQVSIERLINAYGVDEIKLILAPGASIKIENVFLRDNNSEEDKYYVLPLRH